MTQLSFENVGNDQPTKTTLTLGIVFTHASNTTEAEAKALVVEALAAYAKRQGLDIWLRDETECAIGVDEELLPIKVQDHLRLQIVQAAAAQHLENAEVAARARVSQILMGEL